MDENLKNTNKDQVDVDHNDQGVADRLERKNLTPEQERYINRWSWGAFFGHVWWFATSGITKIKGTKWLWIILYIIPYLSLVPWLKFSIQGRRLSWEQRDYKDFEEFRRRERFFTALFLSLAIVLAGIYILVVLHVPRQLEEGYLQMKQEITQESTQEFMEYSEQLDKEISMFNLGDPVYRKNEGKDCVDAMTENPLGFRMAGLRCAVTVESIYGRSGSFENKITEIYDTFIENGWELTEEDKTAEEATARIMEKYRADGEFGGIGINFQKGEVGGSVRFATKNLKKIDGSVYGTEGNLCDVFCQTVREYSDEYDYFFSLFFKVQTSEL